MNALTNGLAQVPDNTGQWLLASAAVLLLGGCASVQRVASPSPGIDIPPNWSAADAASVSGASSLVQWWARFDDPVLNRVVLEAARANNSIKSAQAALRQARALRDVAAAGLAPVVGSSASAQRSKSAGNSPGNSFNVGLDASWELDVFGANRSAANASQATAQASAATLGNTQVSVAAEVALAYISLRSAQVRLAIASDNLASQQDTLQITLWRLQAGLVTELESEQARASSAQTAAQLPALQTAIEANSHALAVLAGQPPAALLATLAATGPMPQAQAGLALDIPANTLRQRPDVRAAELQVMAASANVAQADAALLPNFKLGGSLGLNALKLGELASGAAVFGSLLASVSLPLFNGGALRAQVRAQQAALDQAQLAYQAAVLVALKDVEDALVALRGDQLRQTSLQQAAIAAANAATLARQRYDSGLIDFSVVLETQRTRLGSQDAVASAGADVTADHVRLYKALGGGWQPGVGELASATGSSALP